MPSTHPHYGGKQGPGGSHGSGVGGIQFNLVGLISFLLGIIFLYSAVKNFDPRDVIKNALGGPAPQKMSQPHSGSSGNPLGGVGNAIGGAAQQAGNTLNPANQNNQNQGFLNPSSVLHHPTVGGAIGAAGGVALGVVGKLKQVGSSIAHGIGHLFGR